MIISRISSIGALGSSDKTKLVNLYTYAHLNNILVGNVPFIWPDKMTSIVAPMDILKYKKG